MRGATRFRDSGDANSGPCAPTATRPRMPSASSLRSGRYAVGWVTMPASRNRRSWSSASATVGTRKGVTPTRSETPGNRRKAGSNPHAVFPLPVGRSTTTVAPAGAVQTVRAASRCAVDW